MTIPGMTVTGNVNVFKMKPNNWRKKEYDGRKKFIAGLKHHIAIHLCKFRSIVKPDNHQKHRYFHNVKLDQGGKSFNVRFYCNDGRFYYTIFREGFISSGGTNLPAQIQAA